MRCRGFSLMELLFCLALATVLLQLALPGFREGLVDQQLRVSEQALLRALNLARADAVSGASTVTVCPSDTAAGCDHDWSRGILVFRDGKGDRLLDDEDTLLLYLPALASGLKLHYRAFPNTAYLQFDAFGASNRNGSFTLCPPSGDGRRARQIVISRSGRVRLAADRDLDGWREDAEGKPLSCQ